MMKAEELPPDASTASTGLSLRYIADRIYAYSGAVDVANSELALLEYTSGAGVIVSEIVLASIAAENEDYIAKIYLNNITVYEQSFGFQGQAYSYGFAPIPLIIPPFTDFKLTLQNIADADTRSWNVSQTGRVYDA